MKTLKQIADENGLDKQAVYRFVKKAKIEGATSLDVHQKQKNRLPLHYNDVAESLILSHFNEKATSGEVHQCASREYVSDVAFNAVIDTLKSELEAKNRQIESLTVALNIAQQTAAAAQALHARTMKHLTDGMADGGTAENEPLLGWWARLMGRGKK
jgi:hypothetical protein